MVRPGEVSPGAVSAGVVKPGVSGPLCTGWAPAGLKPVGSGGRLMPNCDSPACNADRISFGRSVTTAARVNSRCSVAVCEDNSRAPSTAKGVATARAPTALMAVEILRRRRFGTGVSSIWTMRVQVFEPRFSTSVPAPKTALRRIRSQRVDGTAEVDVTGVTMLNREPIATLSPCGPRSISLATPGFAMGFGLPDPITFSANDLL